MDAPGRRTARDVCEALTHTTLAKVCDGQPDCDVQHALGWLQRPSVRFAGGV